MGAAGAPAPCSGRAVREDVAVERLRRRGEFRAVAAGVRAAVTAFTLQALRRVDEKPPRVGFTVSKQVGNAVERNRVRRRLREIVRLSAAADGGGEPTTGAGLRSGHDYVLVGRRAALAAPFTEMMRELDTALAQSISPNARELVAPAADPHMRRVRKPVRRPGRSRAALDRRPPTEIRRQRLLEELRMFEHRNTILAIVLSLIVVVGWQYFIGYPQMEKQRREALIKQQEQSEQQQHAAQPSTAPQPVPAPQPGVSPAGALPLPNAPTAAVTQAREAVIAATPHIAIDTPRLKGSIDLKGARLDNLALEQYRETMDPHSPPIVLFSPSGAPEAYYAEFGWVPASGTSQKLPGPDTVWTQEGTGALTVGHPVTLTYDDGQGLVFRRTIAVDDHYLFTLEDTVANKSAAAVTLFPYALISRHGTPKTLGYYILHEGLTGVMGADGLQEETYKKMVDKKEEHWDATDAWLGFTDKYFAAVLLPDIDAKVHARFSSGAAGGQPTYQTDYMLDAQTIAPGATGSADARLFAGAKEVSVVGLNFPFGIDGGYNAALHLNHFDLLIDWGWFYFLTKPMFLGDRLLLQAGRQFRHRHPDRHRHRQAPVLPARQQILRLDGEDEGGAAGDGDDQAALRRR